MSYRKIGRSLGFAFAIALAAWMALNGFRKQERDDPARRIGTRLGARAMGSTRDATVLQRAPNLSSGSRNALARPVPSLPLQFEANVGQTDPRVRYLTRGKHFCFFFTPEEAVLLLGGSAPPGTADGAQKKHVLRMRWVGAEEEVAIRGEDRLPGKAHQIMGGSPHARSADTYAQLRYADIFPKADLIFHGTSQGAMEFDFVLEPGAETHRIGIAFEGADRMWVDAEGDLRLILGDVAVTLTEPKLYQEIDGARHPVSGRYALRGEHEVGFDVAAYDTTRALIIDPVVQYSSLIGGQSDESALVAVDGSGNLFLAGPTMSTDFPTVSALQASHAGGSRDAFITKLDSSGTTILYSTFLGGSGDDPAFGMAVDANGIAYVAGPTTSSNFPMANAFQAANAGGNDMFLSKLSADGSTLLYSTYLGGSGFENVRTLVVNDAGKVWAAGMTNSSNFPTLSPSQGTLGGGHDGFLSVFDTTLTGSGSLLLSTYFGGSGDEMGQGSTITGTVAVDGSGNIYMAGPSTSTNLPTLNPLQSVRSGSQDAFVTRFNSGGTVTFSTYVGGSGFDETSAITVDDNGAIYMALNTASTDITMVNPIQGTYGGGSSDMAILKIDPSVPSILFSTYLGGSSNEFPAHISVDDSANIYVSGLSGSTDFPTVSPIQAALAGGTDGVILKIALTGPSLDFSTYFGGSGTESVDRVVLDSDGTLLVSGSTTSANFPLTANAFQASLRGGSDVFFARLSLSAGAVTPGTEARAVISVSTSAGTAPLAVDFDGSASIGGASNSIVSYLWDFGDGLTASTSSPLTSHTYATAGEFVATLQVFNSASETSPSDHAPIVVGDGMVDDAQMFLAKAAFTLDRSQDDADSLQLSGILNPAGFPSDLSAATITLSLNDEDLSTSIPVSGRQRQLDGARARTPGIQAFIELKSGKFMISGSSVNLKTAISNVRDVTSNAQAAQTKVRVAVAGISADTSSVSGVFENSFRSKEGKSASGTFSYITLTAFSGFFKSQKTIVLESAEGSYAVSVGGPISAELGVPLVPSGDITVVVGGDGTPSNGAELVIPLASLKASGSGAASSFTYSKGLGEVTGLKKFQVSNKKRKWTLATEDLSGTGIPTANLFSERNRWKS